MGTATRAPWRDVYTFAAADGHDDCPSLDDLRERLLALDPESGGPSWLAMGLTETACGLSYTDDGRMHRTRPGAPLHSLTWVSYGRALEIFELYAARDFGALQALPWQPGDGDQRTAAERAGAYAAAAERRQERLDRELLAELGPERPEVPCRESGCARGAVGHSVLCRVHHLEAVAKRPCPAD